MRVMCTGRIDPSFVLRAFSKGADGVFVGACHLNECNYTTHGNFYALRMVNILKAAMKLIGLDAERLRMEFISGSEGTRFAEVMNEFSRTIHELGPIGEGEGLGPEALQPRLSAASKIVPYLKLLERERLRVQFGSREEYDAFFGGDEFGRLFRETVEEKLRMSQLVTLLQGGPLPAARLAESLGLSPSEVSKHLQSSSRHGLVRYDEAAGCYVLA